MLLVLLRKGKVKTIWNIGWSQKGCGIEALDSTQQTACLFSFDDVNYKKQKISSNHSMKHSKFPIYL